MLFCFLIEFFYLRVFLVVQLSPVVSRHIFGIVVVVAKECQGLHVGVMRYILCVSEAALSRNKYGC